ncbi:MAG: hypothetical protein PHC94_04395 [Methylobacter sp.]|nr:hypothetical protein [Methylococcales bacterium]MDD5113231.1 hypothetical protein [Methylobacter sp.]
MTEVLFILTTVFVAYVVYVIVNEPKPNAKKTTHAESQVTEQPVAKPEAVAIEVVKEKKPEASKKTATNTSKETKAAAPVAAGKKGLKDPSTGEVATTYSNYRFTKRWIKDALVAEGFLDKVYKNNELDAEVESKIKQAIAKLEEMEKYRA